MTLEDALFETSEQDDTTQEEPADALWGLAVAPPRRCLGPDPGLHPEDWAIEEEFSATYCRLLLAAERLRASPRPLKLLRVSHHNRRAAADALRRVGVSAWLVTPWRDDAGFFGADDPLDP
jgi:hypothetical protein